MKGGTAALVLGKARGDSGDNLSMSKQVTEVSAPRLGVSEVCGLLIVMGTELPVSVVL